MKRALLGPTVLLLVSCATPDDREPASDANDSAGGAPIEAEAERAAPRAQVVDEPTPPATGVSGGRPPGVSLCYTEQSSLHAATTRHWDVMRRGDLAARGAMIEGLKAAAKAFPQEEEFALLLGLASLWRVAEPTLLDSIDLLGTLDAVQTAQRELERAYALCPTDHRIPAWLGPIKIRMGRMMGDDAQVEQGLSVLERGIAHYPGFVLFSKFLVYADLPASDPDFQKAVDAIRENAVYCGTPATGLSDDPACRNHPRAAHNVEGSAIFLGDMYAKAQDRAAALAAYESAKSVPTYASWDYQALLEQRIAQLDARMAALATPSPRDDLEPAWASQMQCSLCHRD